MSDTTTDNSADYLLLTRLADEFARRYRAGERPSLQEYIDRHPELADEIRELLPTMAEIEQVKEDHQEAAEQDDTQPTPALDRLGDFRILREVGKGGMGIVYEAEQVSLGRHVALKVLPRTMLLDARARRRFEREAKSAARLHHTNIVPVFGVGEQDGLPYYVMQFIQGHSLDAVLEELKKLQPGKAEAGTTLAGGIRLSRNEEPLGDKLVGELTAAHVARSLLTGGFEAVGGQSDGDLDVCRTMATSADDTTQPASRPTPTHDIRPSLSDSFTPLSSSVVMPGRGRDGSRSKQRTSYWHGVASIGAQAGEALDYAHRSGVLHRDIKPSNLLLDTQGTVWVADFGLAKADDQQNLTDTGDILGTLRYMPPEAFEGKADARGDVYSLGLTLYELLAFRAAFDEKERNRLIKQVTHAEPPRLGKLNRQVPRDLQTIVHKAIEKDPARRYATAGVLAEDLHRFIADEPIEARRVSAAERFSRWCRRNPMVAGLTVALAVVFLAGLAGVAWKWREAERQKDLALVAERKEAYQRSIAVEQSNLATRESAYSRRLLYASDLNLAYQAWEAGDTSRARGLLERQRQPAGREEFEWRYLWSLCQDGSRLTLSGHESRVGEMTGVTMLSLTRDGRSLATLGEDQIVCIWDLASRRHVKLLQADVTSAELAADGKILALSQRLGQMVQLWDPVARRVVANLPARAGVRRVAFSPDGRLLAAGCVDGTLRFWEAPMWRELTLEGSAKSLPVWTLRFSPDGKTLASGSVTGILELWDVATRRVRATLPGHSAVILSLSFSPDGKSLASASDDATVRFWDNATGQPIPPLLRVPGTGLGAVAFAPDGKTLATGAADGTIRFWDTATKTARSLLRGHISPIVDLAFAPDGLTLYSVSFLDGILKVWDVAPGADRCILARSEGRINSLAYSPDGKTLAVGDQDGSVMVWDPVARRLVDRLRGHKSPVYTVGYAPDGRTLVSSALDSRLFLWDTSTGNRIGELPQRNGTPFASFGFSPDGRFIAAAEGGAGVVLVWHIADRRQVAEVAGTFVRFSPDGSLLATALNNTVQLWETSTWRRLPPLLGFTVPVYRLAFAPDGKTLAAGDLGGTLWLWDVVERRLIASRRGHATTIESVAFSPNGLRLATAGYENAIKLWDAALLQEVATLTGHDGYVTTVAFSPDGTTLASAGADATVRLWQSPPLDESSRNPRQTPASSPPAEVIRLFGLELIDDNARATLTTSDRTERIDVTAINENANGIQLVQVFDDLQEGAAYTIRFRARADTPRPIQLHGKVAQPDWHSIGLDERFDLTDKWQTYEFRFQAKGLSTLNKIRFVLGQKTGTIWIADFTVTEAAK